MSRSLAPTNFLHGRSIRARWRARWRFAAALVAALVAAGIPGGRTLAAQGNVASTTDPRVGLRPGLRDAAEAAKNVELVSTRPKVEAFSQIGGLTFVNSDLAFRGNYVYQGNFSGFTIWDVSNPASPRLVSTMPCATDQGDPSIYGNLLFISAEATRSRTDCSSEGFTPGDTANPLRARGVRIFDVSDPARPKQVGIAQTCRGSHTHTIYPDPRDKNTLYIYVSGTSSVRSASELAGCANTGYDDPNASQWRIDIVKVPVNAPQDAKVVASARIFDGLGPQRGHGNSAADSADAAAGIGRGRGGGGRAGGRGAGGDSAGRGGRAGGDSAGRGGRAGGRAGGGAGAGGAGAGGGRGAGAVVAGPGSRGCHDITLYPEMRLGGGACGSYGLLLDISDPLNPKRLDAAADSNFAFWHSATFSNDGTKLLFTDEWGGGTQPKCRALDPLNWGGDTFFEIRDRKLVQGAYYKIPAAQTSTENCVAHNGGLIPVPGRDIMVQGWYQGGVSVVDFTDPKKPVEIAYFDRGPIADSTLVIGGSWGAYWYNGYIYSSELTRGLDILRLKPSEFLTQNEIDAAVSVKMEQYNPQSQPKIVWPANFSVPRAYLDQLKRGAGLPAARITAVTSALDAAEKASGAARRNALTQLATSLESDARTAQDAARVRAMAAAVRELASAAR
jgi:hypothetical protein